jgi:hypothetical protein
LKIVPSTGNAPVEEVSCLKGGGAASVPGGGRERRQG